ncbi:IS6 family transposase [Kordiimonas sp. SCSIO 12610]|nr:DDE-type integrase/transposase/recombinase [Kordiimonas sp. SCSIO 12610]UTW54656.1 IS6 family transposase [Kordiimonas sp. SCSIO 12610]
MSKNPFRYFKTSREVIQLAVMMYIRFPLSLRNVEDLLHERGIDVCHESIRLLVDRFGTLFAGEILEAYVSKKRCKAGALKFLKKAMKRYGAPQTVVTDRLKSYGAAMKELGNKYQQKVGQHLNNRCVCDADVYVKIHNYRSDDKNEPCSDSGEREACRNSPRCMPHCKIILMENKT